MNSKRGRKQAPAPAETPAPDVGKILERLRTQRNMTVRELAELSGLSVTFIRAVERGDSDISLGRLNRLANVFHYDLGSFLGFTAKLSAPRFATAEDRKRINRGKGVEYEAIHLAALDLDLVNVTLAPGAVFRDELTHEGIDVLYVNEGEIVLLVNNVEYHMDAGQCCAFSAAYPHKLRNDSKKIARVTSITTGRM